jgi:hypothetical protein
MVNALSCPIPLTDDTSVIIISINIQDFHDKIMTTLEQLNA